MEIRNLITFLRVAELQNFTRAAQELGYSQSNVSAQIKQLEQELDRRLFDRIGKNVFLTSYGEAMIPYAKQAVSTVLQMETFMKSEATLEGTVRVGITDSLSELRLDDALLSFHRRFPRAKLEITLDATAALLEYLRHGQLDAACLIADPLLPTEWMVWHAIETPVVLVANPTHPLAGRQQVSVSELSKQEFVLMESTAPYSRQFENTLSANRLECQPFLRIQSADTARRLVERGPFMSVLPLYTVQASLNEGSLCRIDVPECAWTQNVQLVLHQSKVITPQIRGVLEEIKLALDSAFARKLYHVSE